MVAQEVKDLTRDIIDLTSDNEKNGSELRATGLPLYEGENENGWRNGFAASTHALPDPEVFTRVKDNIILGSANKSIGSSQKPHIPSGSTTAKPLVNPSSNNSNQREKYPPILPGSTVQSRKGDQIHNNGNAGIIGTSGPIYTDNTPKLQRTGGTTNESGTYLVENDEEISLTYSPLRPRSSQPSQLKRRKVHGSFRREKPSKRIADTSYNGQAPERAERTPILPATKTVITGASRELESIPPEVERTLKTQVVSHMKVAIDKHIIKGTLAVVQLQEIGSAVGTPSFETKSGLTSTKVVNKLVRTPDFVQHMAKNYNTLTKEFELALARRAQRALDLEVERQRRSELEKETPTSADSPASVQGSRRSRARDTSSPATLFSNSREESQPLSENDKGQMRNDISRRSNPLRATAQGKNYRVRDTRRSSVSRTQTSTSYIEQSSQLSDDQEASARKKVAMRTTRSRTPKAGTPMQRGTRALRVTVEVPVKQHDKENSTSMKHKKFVTSKGSNVGKSNFGPSRLQSCATLSPPLRSRVEAMIRLREIHGLAPVGLLRDVRLSYTTVATNALEDSLVRDQEWFPQCSDSVTITWTGPSTFVSGALTHYDVHNMQYNRPGNLVVGSTSSNIVKMIDGHRNLRPIVTPEENKENSRPAMRATQDQWRYASVVSTAHCEASSYTFTASYDKTVRIWKVSNSGPSMDLEGIWEHDAFVNFVVTSKYHEKIATASEAHNDAVRVYAFDDKNISQSPYDIYNAEKVFSRPMDPRMADDWAYHPATIQWGRAETVADLLLVGYSPRGISGDEAIPTARKNSGELCCWNTETGEQIHINAGKNQNVFEVIWHPSQPIFLVAAAPSGIYDAKRTKTQVRLFQLQGMPGSESFQCVKTLDCPAADVNELTIMPTSIFGGYVTASCTDGRTYVWDTMHEDRLLHVLAHGESIDNPDPNLPLEMADSGVKFAAWGQSVNRFYTGSSDGIVKVWDITRDESPYLRDAFEAPGGIACGVFSSDFLQLLIGDATGHIHLIRAGNEVDSDRDDAEPRDRLRLPTWKHTMVPHPNPAPQYFDPSTNDMDVDLDPKIAQLIAGYFEEGVRRTFDPVETSTFPVLPKVKSTLKRRQATEDLDLDLEKLLVSDPSEELRRDLEVCGDFLLDFEEREMDFIGDYERTDYEGSIDDEGEDDEEDDEDDQFFDFDGSIGDDGEEDEDDEE